MLQASGEVELARTFEETYLAAATPLELLCTVRYWLALNSFSEVDEDVRIFATQLASKIDRALGQPYTGPGREIFLALLHELDQWASTNNQEVLKNDFYWEQRWFLIDGAKSGRKYEIHIVGASAKGIVTLELKKHKYVSSADRWYIPMKDLHAELSKTVARIKDLDD